VIVTRDGTTRSVGLSSYLRQYVPGNRFLHPLTAKPKGTAFPVRYRLAFMQESLYPDGLIAALNPSEIKSVTNQKVSPGRLRPPFADLLIQVVAAGPQTR